MSKVEITENNSKPTTPATGKQAIYPKNDGNWYIQDDTGTETALQTGSISHSGLLGLTAPADDHTQYALLGGRNGGQVYYGSNLNGESNFIASNSSDAGTGYVVIGDTLGFTPQNVGLVINPDVEESGITIRSNSDTGANFIAFSDPSSTNGNRIQFDHNGDAFTHNVGGVTRVTIDANGISLENGTSVNNISTDGTFAGVTDNDLMTGLAILTLVQAQSGVGGSGTANTIPIWTGTNSLGDSTIVDDGLGTVTIGTTSLSANTIDMQVSIGNNARINYTDGTGTNGYFNYQTGTNEFILNGGGNLLKIGNDVAEFFTDSDTLTVIDLNCSPTSVATFAMGNLFSIEADCNNDVAKIYASGTINIFGNSNSGITIDPTGNLSLSAGTGINEFSVDGALSGNSDTAVPTEKAVKTYVDAVVASDIEMDRISGSTYSTIQQMQDIFHSSGLSSGGEITYAGGSTFDVAAGTGFIRATDSDVDTLLYFDWGSSSGLTIAVNTIVYVGVEYNAGSPQIFTTTNYNDFDFNTNFPLGNVSRNSTPAIHINQSPHRVGDHASLMIQRNYETMPLSRDSRNGGIIISGTGTRNIAITAGALWDRLNKFPISAIDTSVSGSFTLWYRDGLGSFTEVASQTQWPNEQYDDGSGTLVTMTNNRYSNIWFYVDLEDEVHAQYGTAEYTSIALAQAASPPSIVPTAIQAHGKLIGRVTFQKSASTGTFQSAFTTVFSASGAADHGNLSGLSDDDHSQYVLLSGRSGGQILYGGTSASNDLILESTSNATKGSVIINDTLEVVNAVGIGTSSPNTKFEVNGAFGSQFRISRDVAPSQFSEITGGGNTMTFTSSNVASAATHSFIFEQETSGGATELARINSTGFGFGKTPENKIHAYDNSTSTTPLFRLEQAGTGDASIRYQLLSGSWCTGLDNSDSDKFKVSMSTTLGTNDYLTIDTSGNVGIGTSSPNSSGYGATSRVLEIGSGNEGISVLSLYGDRVTVPSTAGILEFKNKQSTGDSVDKIGDIRCLTKNDASQGRLAFYTYGSSYEQRMYLDDAGLNVDQKIEVNNGSTGLSSISQNASGGIIILEDQDGTEDVVIRSYGDTYFTGGNVGIGQSTPQNLLHLYQNNTSTSPMLNIEQDGTGDAALSFELTGVSQWTIGIDNSDSYNFKISRNSELGTNNHLILGTNGNLGLNVTPDAAMVIQEYDLGVSDTIVKLQNNALNSLINFRDLAGTQTWGIGINVFENHGLSFAYDTASPSLSSDNLMMLSKVGNLGLGILQPQNPIHIYRNNTSTSPMLNIEQDGTGDATLSFELTDGEIWTLGADTSNSGNFKIGQSGTLGTNDRFSITASGLFQFGNILDSSNGLYIYTDATGTSTINFSDPTNSGVLEYSHTSNDFNIYTGTIKRFQLNSNGLALGNPASGPQNLLHLYQNSTSTNSMLNIEQDGTGDAALSFEITGIGGMIFGVDQSDSYAFKMAISATDLTSNTFLRADSSTLDVTLAGDLSIGTTSKTSTDLTIKNSTTGTGYIYFNDGSNAATISHAHTSNTLQVTSSIFNVDAANALVLNCDYVDIGSTSDTNTYLVINSNSSSNINFNVNGSDDGQISYDQISNSMSVTVKGGSGSYTFLETQYYCGSGANTIQDIKLLSSAQGRIYFNDGSDAASITYFHASGRMAFSAETDFYFNASDAEFTGLLQANHLSITDGITEPATGTGVAKLYIDSADGDLKIKFADGTVKTIVTDT